MKPAFSSSPFGVNAAGLFLLLVLAGLPGWVAASETMGQGSWLELWAEEKWVPPGGTYHVRIRVTSLGGPGGGTLHYRTDGALLAAIGTVTPPPDGGSGASLFWVIPILNTGQTWEAEVEVMVRADVLAGQKYEDHMFSLYEYLGVDGLFYWQPLRWADANPTTAANPWALTTDDPVNAASGEYVLDPPPDLDLGGPLPLIFQRRYASGPHTAGPFSDALGPNWLHDLDIEMDSPNDETVIIGFKGYKQIEFVKPLGIPYWCLNFHQEPVRYQLCRRGWKAATDFWLMDPAQERVYRFDKDTLTLSEIRDRNGNSLFFTRNDFGRITHIADGLGRTLTFTYAGGLLTRVFDGTRNVDFAYSAEADPKLTGVTDPLGRTTTYGYQALEDSLLPWLTRLTRPAGNTPLVQQWNMAGQVEVQMDAFGQTTLIDYDTPAVHQTRVTHPDGAATLFTHSGGRLVSTVQDGLGHSYSYQYNEHEQADALLNRSGGTLQLTYDDLSGKVASFTDAEGHSTTFTYATQNQTFVHPTNPSDTATFTFYNLIRTDFPDGSFRTFTHDGRGNILTTADSAGRTSRFSYDARGLLLTATNPAGGTATFTYGPDGTLASRTDSDPGIGTTTYAYDASRRLSTVTAPGGRQTSLTYDAGDRLLVYVMAPDQRADMTYDGNGNPDTWESSSFGVCRAYFDAMDRLTSTNGPLDDVRSCTYDAMGRLKTITDANGSTIEYLYDANGRCVGVVNAAGHTTDITYDGEGVPVSVTSPLGHRTEFQTDAQGGLTGITDPNGFQARFTLDPLGRLSQTTDRLDRPTLYTYDAAGDLASVTDPLGHTTAFAYNDSQRLVEITDPRGFSWTFGYSGMGRQTEEADPLGNLWTREYDSQGRLGQLHRPGGGALTYTYDDDGRLARMSGPGGTDLTFAYDSGGHLFQTNNLQLEYDGRGDITHSIQGGASFTTAYDAGGRLRQVTYDGLATVQYDYNALNRLVHLQDNLTGTYLVIDYDTDGRRTKIARSNGVETIYSYDAAGRVTRIQDGTFGDQQITYDAEGNPTRVEQVLPLNDGPSGTIPELTQATFDGAMRLSGPGYLYSPRGERLLAFDQGYSYDGFSRLTQFTDSAGGTSFAYDGLNGLWECTRDGQSTTYFHNYALGGGPIVAEKQGETYRQLYVHTPQGEPLYRIAPGTLAVEFYHYDHLGNTRFLTDGAGNVTRAYAYDPYGNITDQLGEGTQPFTFRGRNGLFWEPELDLYHSRGRFYDPRTASWLTRDPAWPLILALVHQSPYRFAGQNPVRPPDASLAPAVQWFADWYRTQPGPESHLKFLGGLTKLGGGPLATAGPGRNRRSLPTSAAGVVDPPRALSGGTSPGWLDLPTTYSGTAPASGNYYINSHGLVIAIGPEGLEGARMGTIVGKVDAATGNITWGAMLRENFFSSNNTMQPGAYRLSQEGWQGLHLPQNISAYEEARQGQDPAAPEYLAGEPPWLEQMPFLLESWNQSQGIREPADFSFLETHLAWGETVDSFFSGRKIYIPLD